MARHKLTSPDTPDWTLTPQQETAVDLLASGKTVTDTAAAIEVTRQTVQTPPRPTLLVKSEPLNFQEHRSALLQ